MKVFTGPYNTWIAAGGANAATDETIIIFPPPFFNIFLKNNFVNEITDVPSTRIHFSSSSTEFSSNEFGRAYPALLTKISTLKFFDSQ